MSARDPIKILFHSTTKTNLLPSMAAEVRWGPPWKLDYGNSPILSIIMMSSLINFLKKYELI